MRSIHTSSPALTLAAFLLVGSLPAALQAQPQRPRQDNLGSKGMVKKDPAKTPAKAASAPKISRPRPKIPTVTSTTGTLTVVAESEAVITLELLGKRARPVVEEATIEAGSRSVIFDKLQPGLWRISGEADGYKPDAKEWLVKRNKMESVELNLVPITYDLNVSLNADAGEIRYARGNEAPRVATFQSNRARLPGLRPGKYQIVIEANDVSYEKLQTAVDVPGATNDLKLELVRRLSTRDFSSSAASDWLLPAGWSFASGKLIASGRGLAFPREQSFRHYKDFQLSANVKMVNGVAASFVVRARDDNNYYLIQLTGAKADEPYRLRAFVVTGGVAQPFGRSFSIRQIADTLKSNRFFLVRLTMTDNRIRVEVEDSESADRSGPLGILEDPERKFGIGAVCVAARDGEKVEVGSFLVVPCTARTCT